MPLEILRTRHSAKWRNYPNDVIPLHVAEMDYLVAEPIREFLGKLVATSDLGYLGPVPELAPAFTDFAEKRWGWTPDLSHARLACDVGVATVEFLRAHNVSRVIVTSPVYAGFWHWLEELDIEIIDVPLTANFELDIASIEREFVRGVEHVLLCNPHNPLGKVFGRDELTALAEAADRHGAVVISDEIHAPLTYSGTEFVPYLALGEAAERTGVIVTSTSKSWNLAGLKAAFIFGHGERGAELLKPLPEAMHWRSSILGAFSMVVAYREGMDWLDSTIETIATSSEHLASELARLLPAARLEFIPEAGYLAWVDVSELNLGDKPWDRILEEGRVSVVPGTELGPQYLQHVRINFATSPEILTEALTRIAALAARAA
jgi:cystathionine beta-lyase